MSSPAQRNRLLDESRRLERRTDGLILVDITIEAGPGRLARATSNRARHHRIARDRTPVGLHRRRTGRRDRRGAPAGARPRRIAVIGGRPDGPLSFDVPDARCRGFGRALDAAGLDIGSIEVRNGNFNMTGGHEAMADLLDGPAPPTAVFAMSDEMAFGALMAFDERSLEPGSRRVDHGRRRPRVLPRRRPDDHPPTRRRTRLGRRAAADRGDDRDRTDPVSTGRNRSPTNFAGHLHGAVPYPSRSHPVERSTTGPPPT